MVETILRKAGGGLFINYAHRGASEYAPENTFCSFYYGVMQGANGIETDIQKTKDGILILFHDETIDRVTNGSGKVSDFIFDELRSFDVIGGKERPLKDKIAGFEDFLRHFYFMDLHFAIELKQEGVEKDAIPLLETYHMRSKTIITSFNLAQLKHVKALAPQYAVGYLTPAVDENVLLQCKEIGMEQICPKAEMISEELVSDLHMRGFSVRAWGVSTVELMKKVYDYGVDGMTVNFPDRLQEYIQSRTKSETT